jgi:hypothetical protein
VEYDRWITLIENWDPSYGRERAQNLVSQWLKVTNDRLPADRRVPFLNHLFGHIEQRICWDGNVKRKVKWLENHLVRMTTDDTYWPTLRPLKRDAEADLIRSELRSGPKSRKHLMQKFKMTVGVIAPVGMRMRRSGQIINIRRDGEVKWALAGT